MGLLKQALADRFSNNYLHFTDTISQNKILSVFRRIVSDFFKIFKKSISQFGIGVSFTSVILICYDYIYVTVIKNLVHDLLQKNSYCIIYMFTLLKRKFIIKQSSINNRSHRWLLKYNRHSFYWIEKNSYISVVHEPLHNYL